MTARLLVFVSLLLALPSTAFAVAAGDACVTNDDCGTELVCRDAMCAPARKNLVVPFPLGVFQRDDKAGTHGVSAIVPPFVHYRSPREEVDAVPPIFMRSRRLDTGESRTTLGPVFHSASAKGSVTGIFPLLWRTHDAKTHATSYAAIPLFGFHRSPERRGAFVGPFYAWTAKDDSGDFGAGVLPLLFAGKRGPRTHAALLPIFGFFRDREKQTQTVFFGPVVHQTSPDGTRDIIGPVHIYRGKRGYSFGVFPLLSFSKLDGNSRQMIFPLYYRAVDADGSSRLLLLPYYRSRKGNESTDAFFPIFFFKRSPDKVTFVSIFGSYRKEGTRERMMFGPFISRSDPAKKTTTRAMVPFAIVHRSPTWDVTGAIPLVWRVRDGKDVATVVFPLYWRSRGPDLKYDVFFPLGGHIETKWSTTVWAGPFGYRKVRNGPQAGAKTAVLLPLFGYHKGAAGYSSFFMSPLVQRQWSKTRGIDRTMALPFFRFVNREGYTAGVIPLAFAWRRGTQSKFVSPLFYRQTDSAVGQAENVFTLFYWGKKGNVHKGGMFPLVFVRREPGQGASATVLPFGHFGKYGTTSFAYTVPFGFKKYKEGFWFYLGGLIYGRHDTDVDSGAVWPLVYHYKRRSTNDSATFVLPVYLGIHRGTGKHFHMFTPLAYRYRTVESLTTLVAPPIFFDHFRFGESRTTGLLPLYLRYRSEVTQRTSHVIFPLLFWTRSRPDDHNARDAVWFPLVWRFGGTKPKTVVFPIFWDFKSEGKRTTIVFPVFARWTRPGNVHTLVFNTYYRKGVGPNEGTYHFNFIPLFDFGRPRRGDVSWHVLEGLFGFSRQGRNRILHLLWFIDIPLEPVPNSNLTWFGSTPPENRITF